MTLQCCWLRLDFKHLSHLLSRLVPASISVTLRVIISYGETTEICSRGTTWDSQLIRDTYVFNEVELNGHFASTGKYKLSSAWFYLNQLVCLQLLLSGEISAIATPTRIRQNKERRTNDKISMNLHVSFIYPEQNLYQQWGIFLTPFLQKPEENLYRRPTRWLTFHSLWA